MTNNGHPLSWRTGLMIRTNPATREWGLPVGEFSELLALKTEAQQIRRGLRKRAEVASDARRELDLAETHWIFSMTRCA